MSSFLPGLRGIFLVTCWQDAVHAHVETQVCALNAGETTTVWPEVDRPPPPPGAQGLGVPAGSLPSPPCVWGDKDHFPAGLKCHLGSGVAAIPGLGCQCGVGWGGAGGLPLVSPWRIACLVPRNPRALWHHQELCIVGRGGLLCPHITRSTLCGYVGRMSQLPPDPHK